MTDTANESQKHDLTSLNREKQRSMSSSSKAGLIERLKRNRQVRAKFVESHISKGLAFQTRSLREREDWTQERLAEMIGSNQNAIYRAENPAYGKQTLTTLKKIAAAFDVALIVRFAPFSELIDWVSETPRTIEGLTPAALTVTSFSEEEKQGAFGQETVTQRLNEGAANSANASKSAPTCLESSLLDKVIAQRKSAGAMRAAQIQVIQ